MNFLQEQIFTFAVAVAYGIFMGIIFDIYSNLTGIKKINRYILNFLDFFVWIFITLIFLFILLASNWGEIRVYIFLALGIGVLVYYYLLSQYVLEGFYNFLTLLFSSLSWCKEKIIIMLGIIFLPFLYVLKAVILIFKKVIGLIIAVWKILIKFLTWIKNKFKVIIKRMWKKIKQKLIKK